MRAPPCPVHLLLLDETPADHLIDRRLHESRAGRLSLPIALPEVGKELPVVANIDFYSNSVRPANNFLAAAEWASINCKSSSMSSLRSNASTTLPCHNKCFT